MYSNYIINIIYKIIKNFNWPVNIWLIGFFVLADQRECQKKELVNLNKCRFLFHQALDADESKDEAAAVNLYTQAVELALIAVCF